MLDLLIVSICIIFFHTNVKVVVEHYQLYLHIMCTKFLETLSRQMPMLDFDNTRHIYIYILHATSNSQVTVSCTHKVHKVDVS